MTSPADHQALALRSWHRLACDGQPSGTALTVAHGERIVCAAYVDVHSTTLETLRAQALLVARRAFPYIAQPTVPAGLRLSALGSGYNPQRLSFWQLFFPRLAKRLRGRR